MVIRVCRQGLCAQARSTSCPSHSARKRSFALFIQAWGTHPGTKISKQVAEKEMKFLPTQQPLNRSSYACRRRPSPTYKSLGDLFRVRKSLRRRHRAASEDSPSRVLEFGTS